MRVAQPVGVGLEHRIGEPLDHESIRSVELVACFEPSLHDPLKIEEGYMDHSDMPD